MTGMMLVVELLLGSFLLRNLLLPSLGATNKDELRVVFCNINRHLETSSKFESDLKFRHPELVRTQHMMTLRHGVRLTVIIE